MPYEEETPAAIDPDELEEAKREAENSSGSYTHVFREPYQYMGKTFTTMHFDWDSLIGRDSLSIEAELQAHGTPVMVPAFSGPYLIRMASRACKERIDPDNRKLGSDAFELMPIRDYNRIRSAARAFLLASE